MDVGEIVIGTKIDTKGIDSGIKDIQRKLKRFNKKDTLSEDFAKKEIDKKKQAYEKDLKEYKKYLNRKNDAEKKLKKYKTLKEKSKSEDETVKIEQDINMPASNEHAFIKKGDIISIKDAVEWYSMLVNQLDKFSKIKKDILEANKGALEIAQKESQTKIKETEHVTGMLTKEQTAQLGIADASKEVAKEQAVASAEMVEGATATTEGAEATTLMAEGGAAAAGWIGLIASAVIVIVGAVVTIAAIIVTILKAIKSLFALVNNILMKIIDITKQVIKWGIEVLHIKDGYNKVKSMIDEIIFDNDTINNQMKMLEGGLKNLLAPAIQTVVNLVATLLRFFGDLVKLLTGKDIFANISDSLASGAGSAKEIKKQLAGFDEMNVLTDNTGSGGGSGSNASTDLGTVNQKLLDILNQIRDLILNGDWDILAQMISTAVIKGFNWAIDKVKSIPWSKIGEGISDFITNIDFSGIFTKLIELYGELALGIQDVLLSIDFRKFLSNLTTGIADAIRMIAGYIAAIDWMQLAQKLTDALMGINWQEIIGSIIEMAGQIVNAFIEFIYNIDWEAIGKDLETKFLELVGSIKWGEIVQTAFALIGLAIIVAFELITGIVKAYIEALTSGIRKKISETLTNIRDGIYDFILKVINKFSETVTKISELVNKGITFAKNLVQGAVSWVINKIIEIVNNFKEKFENIKSTISGVIDWIVNGFNWLVGFFYNVGVAIGDTFSSAVKGAINGIFDWIESTINGFIRSINSAISIINKVPGVSISRLNEIYIPRLASGAIINQPGRGIPVGGAIAAEAGREGILPLTDERAMAMLGREIGKWITLNAEIPVSIGNRQIARTIREVMLESDFQYNR